MLYLAEVLSALIKNIAQTGVLVFTGGKYFHLQLEIRVKAGKEHAKVILRHNLYFFGMNTKH